MRSTVAAIGTAVAVLISPAGAPADHSILEVGSANSAGQPAGVGPGRTDATPSGTRLFFETNAALVPGDTDAVYDVYMREGAVTTLITQGTGLLAGYLTSTPDGAHVLFETKEQLSAADTDSELDIYRRTGATTTLVSTGPAGGSGPFPVCARTPQPGLSGSCRSRISDDGSRAFFMTKESLVSEDTDDRLDLYERAGATTTLLSTGPAGGNGAVDVDGSEIRVSSDGARVFFTTGESLVVADTDTSRDLYVWSTGTTQFVSTGPQMPGCTFGCSVTPWNITADGQHAFFSIDERLVPADTNNDPDVYRWSAGVTTLESVSADGSAAGGYAYTAAFTPDGAHVFFNTTTAATPADSDTSGDGYERFAGTTTLVTGSPYRECDVPAGYESECNAAVSAVSQDATKVFFTTREALVPADTDFCPAADPSEDPDLPCRDAYMRSGGVTTLLSTGPLDTHGPVESDLYETSVDGTRSFFRTPTALTADDPDASNDFYERYAGQTTLISGTKPGSVLWVEASDDGHRAFFRTSAALIGADTNTIEDAYVNRVAGPGYPRPKGATPTYVPLVPAYPACTAPDRTHGPPLAYASCSGPDQISPRLTLGTPDANGRPAKSTGYVRYGAAAGNPATPADEANVNFYMRLDDVRVASDLSDYEGELELRSEIRIIDRRSGPGADEPATMETLDFPVTVPCAATTDATIGAHCEITTTVEAITPGAVTEGARSIWEFGRARVYDGGPDGLAETQDNTLFAVQGVFVP